MLAMQGAEPCGEVAGAGRRKGDAGVAEKKREDRGERGQGNQDNDDRRCGVPVDPLHHDGHGEHAGVAVAVLRHLSPWQDAQNTDVHEHVEGCDDADCAKDCAGYGSLRIADLGSKETYVVITPIVVGRDQHACSETNEEGAVEVKCVGGKVEGKMRVEVSKASDDHGYERQANGETEPSHDSIDREDAAVKDGHCDDTGCHGHQGLAVEDYGDSEQRGGGKGM